MLPSKGHKMSTCARTAGLLHDRKRHKQVSWISLFLCQLTALDTTACSSAFQTRCPRWQLPRPRQVVAQARPGLSATHPSRGSPCCSERSTIFSHNAGLRRRGTVSSTIFLTAWATGLCHAGGDGLYDTKSRNPGQEMLGMHHPSRTRQSNAPPVTLMPAGLCVGWRMHLLLACGYGKGLRSCPALLPASLKIARAMYNASGLDSRSRLRAFLRAELYRKPCGPSGSGPSLSPVLLGSIGQLLL